VEIPEGAIPFVVVGAVTAWDPDRRELRLGQSRFIIDPTVSIPALRLHQRVIVTGYRVKPDSEPGIVTELRIDPSKGIGPSSGDAAP
jgi:hypothetical protein